MSGEGNGFLDLESSGFLVLILFVGYVEHEMIATLKYIPRDSGNMKP